MLCLAAGRLPGTVYPMMIGASKCPFGRFFVGEMDTVSSVKYVAGSERLPSNQIRRVYKMTATHSFMFLNISKRNV